MRLGTHSASDSERYPRLGAGVDPARLTLTPVEGYLLSRIDGATPWSLLRSIGGVAPEQVDRCLERWIADGVVVVTSRDGRIERSSRPAQPPPQPEGAKTPPADVASAADVDPSLEIPVEVQLRILEFEAKLERPYHEILGVPADAERKELRRAYFALSKELHPDRFFRRNTGSFGKRLDRIFGKIVEAYELLSDPTARAEILRSLAAAAGDAATPQADVQPEVQAEPASEAQAPAQTSARPRAPRRPHVFSLHSRVLRERKSRAKRFFEAGMAAYASGRWVEAASGVRLAIAFDPWNAIYKEQFAGVQRKAHEERASKLIREAESALELRDFKQALACFDEALEYRPHDAELLHRAAKLALATGADLHRAKEWAMSAVELDAKNAAYHRVLGQIYKAAGLEANARRELEVALTLDPDDDEARAALRGPGHRSLPFRWLGGGKR